MYFLSVHMHAHFVKLLPTKTPAMVCIVPMENLTIVIFATIKYTFATSYDNYIVNT